MVANDLKALVEKLNGEIYEQIGDKLLAVFGKVKM
jgi:class 3 adenylate cyclase